MVKFQISFAGRDGLGNSEIIFKIPDAVSFIRA